MAPPCATRPPCTRSRAQCAPSHRCPQTSRRSAWLFALAVLSLLSTAGCGLLFSESTPPPDTSARTGSDAPREDSTRAVAATRDSGTDDSTRRAEERIELPAGHGTLRQEEISMHLERGELQIFVTPLTESITRTAAPDTWERLSSLAGAHRSSFRERTGSETVQLFLVGVHSESQAVGFEPEDLTLVSQGLRFRPLEIRGLAPGWDRQRVGPRETLLAIYAFPEQVDLEGDVEVEYQDVRSRDWEEVLPRIQAERGRVRARAGDPGALATR